MVIEWLEFTMNPEARDRFVQLDFEIWNPFLQTKPGFVRKEIWLDRDDDRRVIIMVEWSDRELWKNITTTEVVTITQQFNTQFAQPYQLIASREFQPVG
jgi:uncharacterized protein (TIGR03792 family)